MNYKTYQNLQNEGHEGYNPYTPEPAPLTRTEMMDRINRTLEGVSIHDPRYDELTNQYNELFMAEWTLETTIARRQEWNSWVKTHNGKISNGEVEAKLTEMGITRDALKEAVKLHNLK